MTTQIEILAITPARVTVALYYPVPLVSGTEDPSREPRGKNVALVPAELAALKGGTLIEVVKTLVIEDLDKAAKNALVQKAWTDEQAAATAAHQAKSKDVDLVGRWFDGTKWT